MSRFLLLAATVCIGTLLLSCDAPTGFDRSNISDPSSDEYVPQSPQSISATADKGVARLQWVLRTSAADSLLIEKSLRDTTSFEEVARTSADTRTFVDSTGHYATHTYYRVSGFVKRDGELKRRDARMAELRHEPIEITSVEPEKDGTVQVEWEGERGVATHVALAVKADEEDTVPLDTVHYEARSIDADVSDFGFADLTLQLSYVRDEQEDAYSTSSDDHVLQAFAPSITSIEYPEETRVAISWQAGSTFEEGFEILQLRGDESELLGTVDAGITEFEGSFMPEPMRSNHFQVRAVHGDTFRGHSHHRSLRVEPPDLEVVDYAQGSFKLEWSLHFRNVPPNGFLVEKKRADQPEEAFKTVHTLNPEIHSKVIQGLDRDVTYDFRVRTKASEPSEVRRVAHQYIYEETAQHRLDIRTNSLRLSPDESQLLTFNSDKIKIWDAATFDLIAEISGDDFKRVAYLWEGEEILAADGHELKRIDVRTGEVESLLTLDHPIASFDIFVDEKSPILLDEAAGWHELDMTSGELASGTAPAGHLGWSYIAQNPAARDQLIVAAGTRMRLFDRTSGEILERPPGSSAFFDSAGDHLMARGRSARDRVLWVVPVVDGDLQLDRFTELPGLRRSVRWRFPSDALVALEHRRRVALWEPTTPTYHGRIRYTRSMVLSVNITSDRQTMYSIYSGRVTVWEPTGPFWADKAKSREREEWR